MATVERNSFDEFVKVNAPKHDTGIDYIRSIYKALDVPADFVLWFARLFWPRTLVVDGKAFVVDLFDKERYESFRQSGHSLSSAQFWTNLLEVTGLFDDLPESKALEVAESLAASWNSKIESECPEAAGRARVIHDGTTGEVFVAIGNPD